MPLWLIKLLPYLIGFAAITGGAWWAFEHVKQIGWDERDALCIAADRAAEIEQLKGELAQLKRERDAATAAANIGRLSRAELRIETGRIHVETENSVEIVRASLADEPVCPKPERVRAEQQKRIDAANKAAAG